MKKRIFITLYIIILVLLDQISKYFFYNKGIGSGLGIIEPAFNTGISWSLPINMIVIIILSIIIAISIIILYKKNYIGKRAAIFLIGGTIGNLIDRILLGGVRDFISIFKRFPIFNLADTFICIGAGLVIIKELFSGSSNDVNKEIKK